MRADGACAFWARGARVGARFGRHSRARCAHGHGPCDTRSPRALLRCSDAEFVSHHLAQTAAATLVLKTGYGCAVGLGAALCCGGYERLLKLLRRGELVQHVRGGPAAARSRGGGGGDDPPGAAEDDETRPAKRDAAGTAGAPPRAQERREDAV